MCKNIDIDNNTHRQAQARVVVGVFADQVHTARCGPYASRLLTVGGTEQIGRVLHTLVVRERLNEFNSSPLTCVTKVTISPRSVARVSI